MQRKESEVDVLKQRMAQQQDRFDQSTAEFEQRLDLARDKERQLISVRSVFSLLSLGFSFLVLIFPFMVGFYAGVEEGDGEQAAARVER